MDNIIVLSECDKLGIASKYHAAVLLIVEEHRKDAAEQAYKVGYVDRGKGVIVPNIVNHLKEHEIL